MSDEMTDEAWAGSLLDMAYKTRPAPEGRRESVALIVAYLKHAASKGIDNGTARHTLRKDLVGNIAPLQVVLRRVRRNSARSSDSVSGQRPSAESSSATSPRA